MSNRETMQQALEALETKGEHHPRVYAAINALRTALAQEHAMHELSQLGQEIKQEPVAIHQFRALHCADWYDGTPDQHDGHGPYDVRTLYTTSPAAQRTWQGLEAEDLAQIESDEFWQVGNHMAIAMAVEAKLKERNT